MRFLIVPILLFILFISCTPSNKSGKKIIDTGFFKIEVPSSWVYKKDQGIDSRIGRIQTGFFGIPMRLYFDYSGQGFANSLVPSVKEYLYEDDHRWIPLCAFCESGTVYTSGSIEGTKRDIMEKKGIKDSALVKVEAFPNPDIEILKRKNSERYEGYFANLTFRDSTISVEIEIPDEIKNHVIEIDTVNNYKRKIIYPKSDKGNLTGVYFKELNSSFSFNLYGTNLNSENQGKAVEAFKTIKFHRNEKN